MSAVSTVLGIMLLFDPEVTVDAEAAAAISEDADRVELSQPSGESVNAPKKSRKDVHVVSETGAFDRQEGVIEFAGNVVVSYSDDCQMCSDRLYMFMVGSNEVNRVVAIGNVAITNDLRAGSCSMAVYRRKKGEIEMFGADGDAAELTEGGRDAGVLRGSRIRFWLDSNQVEVEDSQIETEKGKNVKGGLL